MFLVLLDINNRTIKVYGPSGVEDFFFDEIEDLKQYVGKSPLMYVTSAVHASVGQILSVVQPYIDLDAGDGFSLEGEEDIQFLQSNCNGTLIIDDAGLKYSHKGECKEIDEEMVEIMKASVSIRTLLREGKLKIVDYKTMIKAKRKSMRAQRQNAKLMEDSRAQKDAALDDIIVKSGRAEDIAAGGGMFPDDDNEDVTDSIIAEEQKMQSMTQEEIEQAIAEGKFAT